MALEELAARLPEELRVKPENMPLWLADAIAYLAHCDAMLDAGQPVPTIEEWRQARGH